MIFFISIRYANSQLEALEQQLDKLLSDAMTSSGELKGSRKIRSLELEVELKVMIGLDSN